MESPVTIPTLESPIVLAHGLLGFSRIRFGGFTVASYFNRIPKLLEAGGNRVIQTEVPKTGSIHARAEALRKEIRGHVGTEAVHIIAHSMGGLDARHMITHLDMAGQVLSLSTVGTPHRGTVLADRGVDLAVNYRLMSWLQTLGIPDDAFHDLRTDRCATFNLTTPDVASVRYFSVAGDRARNATFLPLRFSHDVIAAAEGPNDGLVAVKSARQ